MFNNRFRLFSLMGFDVSVDLSWVILAALLIWTLAQGHFPQMYPGFDSETYLMMGIIGALGLFVSIVLHELAHSIVAQRYGLPISGITLFIFGGIAEMEDEPPSPKAEGMMAIAGPIASYIIAGIFISAYYLGDLYGVTEAVTGVLFYLGMINLILATFNMIPGFPLDGGRVLRSILWAWQGDLKKATWWASAVGSGFAALLILNGIISLFAGFVVSGIWWSILGAFLWSISRMHYRQVMVRQAFQNRPVERFMNKNPASVSPELSIREFVDQYVYPKGRQLYPVKESGQLQGCITIDEVKEVPKEEWPDKRVKDLMQAPSKENTVTPDMDVSRVLRYMQQHEQNRMMVVKNDHLEGVIALEDLLNYVMLKMDLEGEVPSKPEQLKAA